MKRWMKNKISSVLKLLDKEVQILKDKPFKIRLYWFYAYPFYLHKMLRIKMYDYSYNYRQNLNIIKEVKAFISTALIGTNAVLRLLGNNHFLYH
jgi:hypothetical protein